MKVAISLPDPVFRAAEVLASHLHKSRSQLYAEALASYVGAHSAHNVTQRLNDVYAKESSQLDRAWLKAQMLPLSGAKREAW
jgi:metal-responsive CopG/Arc/MetJ family transcriptional regulator